MTKQYRMAMVGGGVGSFIGPIHKLGADMSGRIKLVAGAFSSDKARSGAAGAKFGLAPERCYADYREMLASEQRAEGIDIVVIATPNHLHLPVALAAIEAGCHILSDKPATATLDEALRLRDALSATSLQYALTYTYTAFPMVREARARIQRGDIGKVRKVMVNYAQGWMSQPLETMGNERAKWRTDPGRSGVGGCIGDIGVHAFNLAEYVSGERVQNLLADVRPLVPGRALDDDANVLVRFAGGQAGVLTASQVAVGERNNLSFSVYGETGAFHWSVELPDQLRLVRGDATTEISFPTSPRLTTGVPLPPGFATSMITPFAQMYLDFATAIDGAPGVIDGILPGIEEGVRSMRFVETAVESSRSGKGWASIGG